MKKNLLGTIIGFILGSALIAGAVGITPFQNIMVRNQGEVRLAETDANGTNYVAVKAPASLTGDRTCTLEDDSTPFDSCVSSSGTISGLTTGRIPKAASATSLTDSLLNETGGNVVLTSGELRLPAAGLAPYEPILFTDPTTGGIERDTDGSGNGFTYTISGNLRALNMYGDPIQTMLFQSTNSARYSLLQFWNDGNDGLSFYSTGSAYTGSSAWNNLTNTSIIDSAGTAAFNLGTSTAQPVRFFAGGTNATTNKFLELDGTNVIFTPQSTGTVDVRGNSTQAGQFRLYEDTDDGSNYASFKVPALAANTAYTLPADDGDAGEQLQTDGSGALTWEAAGSGGGTPAGATGDIQYNNAGAFGAEAAFNYDATNNRYDFTGLTAATDGTDAMAQWTGTMPTVPSTHVNGIATTITGAGSASQTTNAFAVTYAAGYTGSSYNAAVGGTNLNSSTGTNLQLTSGTAPSIGVGVTGSYGASTTGSAAAVFASQTGSGNGGDPLFGVYARAGTGTNNAAPSIGIFSTANSSTEGTNLKNVAVYGTLNTSLITGVNGSFAGLFDGGTLPDANSNALQSRTTLPASPSAAASGVKHLVTGAGTASQVQSAEVVLLLAGYTGASATHALYFENNSAGTANNLNLGVETSPVGNFGLRGIANGTTSTGLRAGLVGEVAGADGDAFDIGVLGKAAATAGTPAAPHIGIMGAASGSTEATDLKNVGGYFTLDNTLITGANISVALLAQGDGTDDIFRGYDDTTLMFRMEDTGEFTSAGTATLGWAVVDGTDNQACSTTCTFAAVYGIDLAAGATAPVIVDATSATADVCLCAGAS